MGETVHFVFNSGHFDPATKQLLPSAFRVQKNPQKQNRLEASTCLNGNLAHDAIAALGVRVGAFRRSGRRSGTALMLRGWSEISFEDYSVSHLSIDPTPREALPEHADIIGWELAMSELNKTEEQLITDIASRTTFVQAPPTVT